MLLKLNPSILHAMQNASFYLRLKASKLPLLVVFVSCLFLFLRALSGAGIEPQNANAPPSRPNLDLTLNHSAVDLDPKLDVALSRGGHAHIDDIYQRWAAFLTCASPAVPPTDSDSDGAEINQFANGGTDVVTCLRERLAGVIRPSPNANADARKNANAKRGLVKDINEEKGIEKHRSRMARMKRDEGLLRDIEYMTMAHGY